MVVERNVDRVLYAVTKIGRSSGRQAHKRATAPSVVLQMAKVTAPAAVALISAWSAAAVYWGP